MTAAPMLPTDTSREAMQIVVDRWRAMTPADKLRTVDAASRGCDALAAAGVRQRHPDATDDEVRLRVIALRLGRDLMVAAYGWDPDLHGW